ncbi:transposase [Litoribacter populi]|uniref:transposase n=1 Tax=Litoribacter populi TaxID=2598460 RepID=UPI00163DDB8A|nr:transposase [Litoribacter populi]
MRNSHTEIWTHLVISAKSYQPLFKKQWVDTIDETLRDFIGSIPDHRGTFCIMPDHIHFLVKLPDDLSLNSLVDQVKSVIKTRLKETFVEDADNFDWEPHHHAHSVSLNRLSVEKSLIERQLIKHKEMSLEEELKFFGM